MIASRFARPFPRPAIAPETMWIESATAMVRTMSGTPALTGLNTVPTQPANPKVVLIVNMSTATTATVARAERSTARVTRTMTRKANGVSFSMSSLVASANARFIGTSPVTWKATSGCSLR